MPSIIWDWNGTLLNDLDFCIATINVLLKKRQLNLLDHYSYKEIFSFPVKDYYAAIGFDFSKEDFSIPAREFIELYNSGVDKCSLHTAAIDVLNHFKHKGIKQFVLSAMKQNMLEQTLMQQNIFDYFEGVAGLNDHYAVSKIERGEQLIEKYGIKKEYATIIGDTDHDFEVASQLEIDCILVADGHQSKDRLLQTGATVIDGLQQLKSLKY
ncbi:HAD hydrolase-like protein [uncultured Draconibacterium sp.]|uniref:HAD family hydrolase n=1 Tax=uncultured Draconibacterium sp. TaxID=1573823 RepID=UPI00260110F6|nr:HAD hydrolase-like protein [uncultured Draconibacterium sp.]